MVYNTAMDILLLQWKSRIITMLLWLPARIVIQTSGCSVKRSISYGQNVQQRLDIYAPKPLSTKGPLPVAVVVHGGGWIGGDKTEQTYFCAKLAKQGYIVCAINYRLAPRHRFPAALDDCSLALAWIRSHSTAYGGNPRALFIAGSSAGAHLAALVAGRDNTSSGIKGLILYYGVYDLQTVQRLSFPFLQTYLRAFLGPSGISEQTRLKESSPITFVTNKLPPVLAITSECDTLHPQTDQYITALHKANVPCELLFLDKKSYPHAPHGFQPVPGNKAAKDAFAAALRSLPHTDKATPFKEVQK